MTDRDPDRPPQLTDEELDRLLTVADDALERQIRARSDVDALLTGLFDAVPPAPGANDWPSVARVRLRSIIAALYRADILAAELHAVYPDKARARGLAGGVTDAFTCARVDDLATVPDLLRLLTVATARALATSLSRTVTTDHLLESYLSAVIARLIRTLGQALAETGDLAVELDRLAAPDATATMDLCGMDLSRQRVSPIDVLFDFIWDDATIWPAGVNVNVLESSVTLGDGRYRIITKSDLRPCG
ncbi:hypothetical protein ACIBG8_30060 [Nonomuraea sp. NPDC050556]|uniref:hypothetical protein n=1 Tax=Nonomuraea sp. NPDC050556 TaxID=3364369 RepID=UPI0037A99613